MAIFMAQISVLIQNVVPTDDFYTGNESKNIKKERKKYDREKAGMVTNGGLNFVIFGFVAIILP